MQIFRWAGNSISKLLSFIKFIIFPLSSLFFFAWLFVDNGNSKLLQTSQGV